MEKYKEVEVKHIFSSEGYYCWIQTLCGKKTKTRFIFDSKWDKMPESEEMVKAEWESQVEGSRMSRVHQKLKKCKWKFIK